MKFRIQVKSSDQPWYENYNKPALRSRAVVYAWSAKLVQDFNNEEIDKHGAKAKLRQLVSVEYL